MERPLERLEAESLERMHLAGYALLGVFVVFLPLLVRNPFQLHIFVLTLLYLIAAVGLGILLGIAGQWSFTHLGFAGIGAILMHWLNIVWGVPYGVATVFIIVSVTALGGVLAIPAFRAERHYFALTTLALIVLIHQGGLSLREITGGGSGFRGYNDFSVVGFSISTRIEYYYLSLFFVIVLLYFAYRIIQSDLGSVFIAIRENEKMAENLGVNTFWYKVLAFAIGAGINAFAGVLFTAYLGTLSPTFYHPVEAFLIVVMVVVGGSRRISGWVIGAIFVFALPEFLRTGSTLRLVIFGVLLLVILYLEPRGLVRLILDKYANVKTYWNHKSTSKGF